jgi:sugar phosphate isomerase/epimerase
MRLGAFPSNNLSLPNAVQINEDGNEELNLDKVKMDYLVCQTIKEGFTLMELSIPLMYPGAVTPEIVESLNQLKKEHNLTYNIHFPFLGLEPASVNKHIHKATVECCVEAIELTKSLDPEVYILHTSGGLAPLFIRPHINQAIRKYFLKDLTENSSQTVGEIIDLSGISSEKIAIENLNFPFELTLGIIEENNTSICIDTGHILAGFSGEYDLLTVIKDNYDKIADIHLHDSYFDPKSKRPIDHQALGTGLISAEILYYLEKREFSKPVMLEMNLPQAIQSLKWIKQNCQEINITL